MSRPAIPSQLRFFLLDAQEGGAARTLVKQITVEGAVDAGRLRTAWTRILAAQLALRTSLHLAEEELTQCIHPVDDVDVRVKQTHDPDALLDVESAALSVPLEHGAAPLCQVRALIGPRRTYCLVAVHHAVFDEDSSALLLGQLAAAYDDPNWARPSTAAEAPTARPDGVESLRAFWADYLDGCPEDTALPWTSDSEGRRRAVHSHLIPAALAERIRERARQIGATPFAQFLSAVGVVVGWYLDRDDAVLGVVVGGRGASNDQVIGCLQNTVPVRISLAGTDTTTVVDRTMDALFDAVEHSALPIEDILAGTGAARGPGRKPLTQILCTESFSAPQVQQEGLHWWITERPPEEVEYDCGLALSHLADGGMRLDIEYRSGGLPEQRVQSLAAHLVNALGVLGEEPGRPLEELDLLTTADRQELAVLDGGPAAPVETPVHALVSQHARSAPESIAVSTADQALSYGELESRASVLAAVLAGRGTQPGDRVGIYLPRTPELLVAILAVWKSGAMYVPLDPDYPARRLRDMAEDAELAMLLADRDAVPGRPWLDPSTLGGSPAPAQDRVPATDPQVPAYLIYTSGSTGRPKGIVVSHTNLSAVFTSYDQVLGEPPQVTVAGTSLSFDISVLELFWPLTRGRTVLLTGHRWVAEETIPDGALYQCTPSVARLLVGDAAGRLLLGRLETLLVGGEPLPSDLAEELAALVPGRVMNCYGPTETTVWSTMSRVAPGAPVRIGTPLPGESCHVLDARGRLLPPGVPGRLFISGSGISEGYWQLPDLDKERFVRIGEPEGPRGYDTGDRVMLDGQKGLCFLGRRDSQVKVLGQRIELEEVETALRSAPGIRDIAVAATPDADQLVAFLTKNEQTGTQTDDAPSTADPSTADTLCRHADGWLVPAAIPQAWFQVPALPQLPNGKLDRGTLNKWAASHGRAPGPRPTATPAAVGSEALVRHVWEQVLRQPVTDATASFFELGGTSSGLLKVLAALRPQHPWLTAADLFRHTTLWSLAVHIDGVGSAPPSPPPDSAPERGRKRASAMAAWRARSRS